jgi:arylformamidase
MADGSPVNVSALTMSTHTGAHADAPLHYAADAPDIASVDLAPYLGECVVVDARKAGPLIAPEHLPDLARAERVLFRTFAAFPHDDWAAETTAIAPEAIDALAGLVLDAVPPGRYELIALPLAIVGGDASPVRAVLRELA